MEELSKKDTQKEQLEAEAPIINPGLIGNRLMLTAGNGLVLFFAACRHAWMLIAACSFPNTGPPMMPNGTGMGMPPVSHVAR